MTVLATLLLHRPPAHAPMAPPGTILEVTMAPYAPPLNIDLRFAPGLPFDQVHATAQLSVVDGRDPIAAVEVAGAALRTLVQQLSPMAVVIHGAGEVVLTAGEVLRRLMPQGEGSTAAFVWIDVGQTPPTVWTMGLAAFGLPDVRATAAGELDDDERYDRAQEAAMMAVHQMMLGKRRLEAGDTVAVPLGVRVGGSPIEETNVGLELDGAPEWNVREVDADYVWLEPTEPLPSLAAAWAASCAPGAAPLPYPAYRRLLTGVLEREGSIERHARPGHEVEGVPPYEVLVLERAPGRFDIVTCGMARIAQPGGAVEDHNAYVEVAVQTPAHDPQMADMVGVVGFAIHGKAPGSPPVGPYHRLGQLPTERWPFDYVVMGVYRAVELGAGPPILLYAPAFMSSSERAATPLGENEAWFVREQATWRPRWLGKRVLQ